VSDSTCKGCGAALAGEYCSTCGERRLGPEALSLRRFFVEAFEAVTNIEGKFPRSLWALLTEPGRLTAEYCVGRRAAWVRPFQLFLLVAIAFFLFSGWQTFSTPLRIHLQSNNLVHRALAERLVTEDLAAEFGAEAAPAVQAFRTRGVVAPGAAAAHAELLVRAERFDAHGQLLARSLVFVMIPLLALGVWLLRLPRPGPGVMLVVYTTHFTTALLLILILSGVVMRSGGAALRGLGLSDGGFHETTVTFAIFTLVGIYAALSMRGAFGDGARAAFLRSFLLVAWLYFVLLAYRALLFFVVRWTL
jgi:hypothetical protein